MEFVKKKGLVKILCAAATLALLSPAAVYAAGEPETVYPENFTHELTFSKLSDYAVNGDDYAFADGTKLKLLYTDALGDRKLTEYDCGVEISSVDYAEGKLYYADATNRSYEFINGASKEKEYSAFKKGSLSITLALNDVYFLINDGGTLSHFKDGAMTSLGEGFSLLKEYGGKVYALKDGLPCAVKDEEYTALNLAYVDFTAADGIALGNVAQALKASYTVKTATLEKGCYCTEIDLNGSGGGYFKQIKTFKTGGVHSALALAESGNATVIAMRDPDNDKEIKCYLTLTSSLTELQYSAPANDVRGAYALTEAGVYSSPYISEATKLGTLPAGAKLTVTEKFSLNFINNDFYKITYEDEDGTAISGYVTSSYLSPYSFSAGQNVPQSVKGEADYSTNVQTVVLILVIVGLVIIAIVYLTMVGTKSKKKKQQTDDEPQT